MRRPARLRWRDLVSEAAAGILQRPGRTGLTSAGVVLGVGAFVAVLGVAATASGQISERFTALVATEVVVEEAPDLDGLREGLVFPPDADARVSRLNGVVDAGVFWQVPGSVIGSVRGVPLPGVNDGNHPPVVAASPGIFGAVGAVVAAGRAYDNYHDGEAEHVVVLGRGAASRLGIARFDVTTVVFINDIAFTVVGVIEEVDRHPELLTAVLVPRGTVERLWGAAYDTERPPRMVVDTELGAGQLVASQVALALRPDLPAGLRVTAPPDPRSLREQVSSDLSTLFLVLAGVSLLIGAAGIANTMVVAVLERVPEIGLRRALGARPAHIAAQFLLESVFIGAAGGLVGGGTGVACVVVVAAGQRWTPVMEPAVVVAAPMLGAVVGLVAGVYPAVRAALTQPVEALRRAG